MFAMSHLRELGVAEVKAQLLRIFSEVNTRRERITVTKNGKRYVQIVPIDLEDDVDPLEAFKFPGLKITGDITKPIYTDEEWEQFAEAKAAKLSMNKVKQASKAPAKRREKMQEKQLR
jgi:hypothetical protein